MTLVHWQVWQGYEQHDIQQIIVDWIESAEARLPEEVIVQASRTAVNSELCGSEVITWQSRLCY
jgi:hypothetical protein